jgi:hypothetical protein
MLQESGGMSIPLFEDRDSQAARRIPDGTPPAPFPSSLLQK